MLKRSLVVLMPVLLLTISLPLMAQEKAKRAKRKQAGERAGRQVQVLPQQLLQGLELTAEQQAKLDSIAKEMRGPVQEARTAANSILTDEQKAARKEALAAAKEAGKKPREAQKAVEAALRLTEEQQAKMAKAKESLAAIQNQIREKVMEVLTPEQRKAIEEKMKKARGDRVKKGKGAKAKKPASKE
jgi:Spy/CpxP family protein refolding chaperone